MPIRLMFTLAALIAVLALVGVVAVGVSYSGAGSSAQGGDTLRLVYGSDPDTLNPLTANDSVSEAFQRQVYEGLADRDFPDPDKWIPGLATHWEFDEEKLQYTIHLRRGVMWHPMRLPNGKMLPDTELTSRDVKFTFDCILNPHIEATSLRSYYLDPEAEDPSDPYKIEVKVVDKYTVTIRWKKPYFLAKTWSLGIAPIPRHVYSVDENGEPISFDFSLKEFADGFNNHWANTRMCGTGPMMYKEWKRGRRMVLVRNPNYWGKPFNFRRLTFRFIANPNTVVQKVLQNDLDFAGITRKDQYLEAKTKPTVLAGKVKLVEYEYPGYRYIGYNMNRAIFKDRRFRTAMSYAIPVQRIIDRVWKGLAVPSTGPFLPGSSASDDSIKPIPFDLEKAKQLLEEAGWRDTDRDGIRDKMIDSRKVSAQYELMIYSDAPQYKTVAEIIKENCRKIGVRVNIAPAKWALMLQKLRKREFDACMLGWMLSWTADPNQLWHSKQADEPDSSNHVAYRNPELDKVIDRLRVTMDEDKQIELYHEIHRIIFDDQPYTFLFQDMATAGYDSRIRNVHFYKIRPCVDSREWYASDVGESRQQAAGSRQ